MDYINKLLIGICNKLQLQPNLYESADKSYNTIATLLQESDKFNNVDLKIYPQGSFRLKTTVKPLKGNEFDLDFVAELPENADMTAKQLYENIYLVLSTDGIHNNMLEKKSRCIRIKYANDFHIDIMPGKSINRSTNEIIVPDRNLSNWYHHSNPIGYADWFENQAKTQIRRFLFENRMSQSAEPIDEQEVTAKLEPLRRAVQLVKRYRDVYCEKNNAEAVRSIVICTLMGHISSSYSNEIEIIDDFCRYVNRKIQDSQGKPFVVKNPVVNEILTEKWEEDINNYKDFKSFINNLTTDMEQLKKQTTNISIVTQMKKMFGDDITNDVVKENTKHINDARKAGTLAVGTNGLLNTNKVGASVLKNTFYGK